MSRLLATSACMACLLGASLLAADEYRYVQDGGTTFRERVAKVAVQYPETTFQDRQVTQYCPRTTTSYQSHTKVAYLPVKDYHWEPRYHGRWNPFVTPGVSYEWKPTTRWVAQTQTYQTPITQREFVPQTQTVRQPTTTWRVVERQQIVERVAIAPGWVPGPGGTTLVAAVPGNSGVAPPQSVTLAPQPGTSLAPVPTTSVLTNPPAVASQPPVIIPTAPPASWPAAYPAVARREQIGGISRFESDPPRYGSGNFR